MEKERGERGVGERGERGRGEGVGERGGRGAEREDVKGVSPAPGR